MKGSNLIVYAIVQHEKTKLEIAVTKVQPFLHYMIVSDAKGGRHIPISKELFNQLKKELL